MKNKNNGGCTLAWSQYEAGLEYNEKLSYDSHIRENERYYRGDQWSGVDSRGLPTPTFNIIKRIIDYIIATVLSSRIEISLADNSLSYISSDAKRGLRERAISQLSRQMDFIWSENRMNSRFRDAALEAAISGDAVFYSYWDESAATGQIYSGDIKCELIEGARLFVADPASDEFQRQAYIIISGSAPVSLLREEARCEGLTEAEVSQIRGDLGDDGALSDNATYLIKFCRNEDGLVIWEKCVRGCVIKSRASEWMTHYPVAYFRWDKIRGSYHGSSPITSMIQNQKYINKAFALMMKHMIDTAFSKVVYDKKLIPEWSNEVGEAIGVISGGDVGNVVKVIGTGEMQDMYLDVIERTVELTKALSGATEVALGESNPSNTSAIMALQAASELPFDSLRDRIYRCAEDIVDIWCDMVLEYYPEERSLTGGETPDYNELCEALIHSNVKAGAGERFTEMYQMSTLNRLLDGHYITAEQYIRLLPDGIITDREALLMPKNDGGKEVI